MQERILNKGQDKGWDDEKDQPDEEVQFEIMNYPADTSLKGYKEQWDREQLKIPDFQRKYVWDQKRASKLIESFLLGLTVPGVFLYKERDSSEYLVIDGQQRIKTVVQFLNGKFEENDKKFTLKEVNEKWEGKSFETLAGEDQFKLETAIMRSTIIQQLNPKDKTSIYLIFERLNTGGINLTPMEVRMCVSEGKFTDMLVDLNKNEKWRKIFGDEEENYRSRDKELILRILALYDKGEEYKASMKGFLNKYMSDMSDKSDLKGIDDKKIKEKKETFLQALEKASFLGDKPFRLTKKLNFSFIESVFVALMKTSVNDREKICKAYKELKENPEFIELVKSGQTFRNAVHKRLKIAEQAFFNG